MSKMNCEIVPNLIINDGWGQQPCDGFRVLVREDGNPDVQEIFEYDYHTWSEEDAMLNALEECDSYYSEGV